MARFSMGLWDSLFGKRFKIEIPSAGGETVTREVTQKWLDSMEAAGQVSRVDPTPRAQRLIAVIRVGVIAAELDLAGTDSTLNWVLNRLELWRFFLTAASIGLAATQETKNGGMVEAVDQVLFEEDPQLRAAVVDFLNFVFKRDKRIPSDELTAQIGLWVLWNVKATPDPPGNKESFAAAKVGHFCLRLGAIWETAPV